MSRPGGPVGWFAAGLLLVGPRAADSVDVEDVEEGTALPRAVLSRSVLPGDVPAHDVLPRGVRRPWSRRDALLPLVLTGELMVGVLLQGAWQLVRATPGPAVSTPVAGPPATAVEAVVVVPPAPVPTPAPPPPPPRRVESRNPFAAPPG